MGVMTRQSGHKTAGRAGGWQVIHMLTTVSPHLSRLLSARPRGHRGPAFEEFTEQMSEQMIAERYDEDSGRESMRELGTQDGSPACLKTSRNFCG